MKTYAVDFESFYSKDVSISTHGTWHYIRHSDVDIYLVSIVGPGVSYSGAPESAPWEVLQGNRVICHNFAFDGSILTLLRERGVIPPSVQWADEQCTADMAAYCGYARALKDVAGAALGKKMSKDVRDKMKGIRYSELDQQKKDEVIKYALLDSETTLELWEELSPLWPEWERKVSQLTRKSAWRGARIDVPRVEKYLINCTKIKQEAEKHIPWVVEGKKILSLLELASYCRSINIPPPETTEEDSEEFLSWEKEYGDITAVVTHLRRWRKANILEKRLTTMRDRTRPDGTMALELKYFGANQTGRFSGTGGFNPQNMARDPLEGMDVRGCIISREGHSFLISDLSQIEPRVLNYLVKNERMLQAIRQGWGVYEAFAKGSGMWNGEAGTMKKNNKTLYAAAKAQCLGCGYGMSGNKFYSAARLLTMGMNGPEYEPTSVEAEQAVSEFRMANPEIVQFWKSCEKKYRNSSGTHLITTLPSGRPIRYWNVGGGDFTFEKELGKPNYRYHTYGAKIVENATQGTARDVFCWMLLELDRRGYSMIFTAHDEAPLEIPDELLEKAKVEVNEVMSTPPPWMPNLPLACEMEVSKFYKK